MKRYKEILFYFYIEQRNRFNIAYSEISFLNGLLQTGMIFYLILKDKINIFYLVVLGFLTLILIWIAGTILDKMQFVEYQTEWGNKRNPFVKEIRKNKKI